MKAKIIIMAGIFLVGGVLFLPQITAMFPNNDVMDAITVDVSNVQKDTVEQVGAGIDEAGKQIDDIKESSGDFIAEQDFLKDIVPVQLQEIFSYKEKDSAQP